MLGGAISGLRTRGIPSQFEAVLKAYALVPFGGDARVGAVVMLVTLSNPSSAALGLLAVLVAHRTAILAGYAREGVASGYYGYNALLVGLALAQYGPLGVQSAVLVSGGAVLAALLTAVFGDLLRPLGLPVLALPFVVVTTLFSHTMLAPGATPFWLAPQPHIQEVAGSGSSILRALGAIVFRPTEIAGLLVLAAVTLHSRITACALLAGALIGACAACGVGARSGALMESAAYNGALTFGALGAAFYVPGRAAFWMGAFAAALSGWLTMAFLLPFAPLSIPVLAWPFVLVTLCVMRALALRPPGRVPTLSLLPGAPPEANLAYARTFALRLKVPGPPCFVLPVRGAWQVTQGVDGAITHRGPWRHALDFEIVDTDGFPFRGDGSALGDYHCFGQPVLAPGSGTVVAVHDGAEDNPPGRQDLVRPWGNAVVLSHGLGIYSVVAHLRHGSIGVVVGQAVLAGQPLAQCGASGRSPRPHLHFQAQASPVLGAPTLDFRIANYVVRGATARLERLSVPVEGESVHNPEPQPLQFPSAAVEFAVDGRGPITLRHEITVHGEHRLTDADHDERLYFVPQVAGTLFTALQGSPDGLLGSILQLAPNLPALGVSRLRFEEELPPELLLPGPFRVAYQLLAVFGEAGSARVSGDVARTGDTVIVESECQVRLLGRLIRRRRGRLVLDRHGLREVELFTTGSRARAVCKAARLVLRECGSAVAA